MEKCSVNGGNPTDKTQQSCFIVKRGGLVSTHMQVLDHIDNASSVWTLIAPENHFSLDWNTGGL